jgi:hypothetical protein
MLPRYQRVTPDELLALMRESARILDLGSAVAEEELDELRDWKIDVLNRIALDPGPCRDETKAEEVREIARREATALRLGLPATWGETRGESA